MAAIYKKSTLKVKLAKWLCSKCGNMHCLHIELVIVEKWSSKLAPGFGLGVWTTLNTARAVILPRKIKTKKTKLTENRETNL